MKNIWTKVSDIQDMYVNQKIEGLIKSKVKSISFFRSFTAKSALQ